MSSSLGAVTPVNASSLAEALPHLRRPFSPAAVKYKIQTNPKTPEGNALIVAFIDARLVAERLNAVCPDGWSDEYVAVPGGMMCRLTVLGQTRCDVGWSKGTGNDMDLKSLYSDAFKRAAVKFGIGVSIYALPQTRLKAPEIKLVGGKNWYIQSAGTRKLEKVYADFLAGPGAQFGTPLDHGDSHDSQGGEEVLATREETASTAPASAAAPKQEEPQAKPAGETVNPKAVPKIIAAFTAGSKTLSEVEMFLVSKGFEDIEALQSKSMEEAFGLLTSEQAAQLHAWLKKSA